MEVDDAANEVEAYLHWLVKFIALSHALIANAKKQWHESLQNRALKRTRERLHLIMQMLAQCHLNECVKLYTADIENVNGPLINGQLGCVQIDILNRAIFDEQCVILLTKKEELFHFNPQMGSTQIFQIFNEVGYKPVLEGGTLDYDKYKYWVAQNKLEEKARRKVRKLQEKEVRGAGRK